VVHLLLALSLFIASGSGAAAETDATQSPTSILEDYNVTVWTEREGLSSTRVIALAQTPDGYLWLGTVDGLIRFDGTSFEQWNAIGSPELPVSRVAGLSVHADGSLWVGYTEGQVARVTGVRATVFDRMAAATGGTINALATGRDGRVWIGGRTGLLRFDGLEFRPISPSDGLPEGPVLNTFEDHDGTLWITLNTGIFRRTLGAVSFVPFMSASYFGHRVTVDRDSSVWVTDPRRGFKRVAVEGPRAGSRVGPIAGLGVQVLHSRLGAIWIATLGQGLWRLRSPDRLDDVEVLTSSQGLLNEVVRCLAEDREGNIWVGTDYGLLRLSRNKLIPVQRLGVVRVVQADGADMWVGTSNGLLRLDGATRRMLGHPGGLPWSFVSALHLDGTGALWIATDRGIVRHRKGRFQPVPIKGIERLNRLYSMTLDTRGRLWLADFNRGLFIAAGGRLEPASVPGLDHRSVLGVHPDGEGRFWLSSSDGRVGFVEDVPGVQRFTALRLPPGLSARLNSVIQARAGEVWLLTSAGVWHYRDGQLTIVNEKNGLPSAQIDSGAMDDSGNAWLGTSAGVVRMDHDDVDRVAANPNARVTFGLWDTYDGAAGYPLWLGRPGVARDPKGRFWFVTTNGLSIADPRRLQNATTIPPVIIKSIAAGSTRLGPDEDLTFPPRSSPVEINYSTVMLSETHKMRFRYRLENFENQWTEAGSRRQALLMNLPPGSYTFRVMAVSNDGSATESSATARFVVRPALTQTPWFFIGLSLLLALGLWQAWQARLRREQHQVAMVINERLRMSREIHDTLLQSLVGVALQLDVLSGADTVSDEARAALIRSRREVEDNIRNARQTIWNLRSPRLQHTDIAALVNEAGQRITSGTTARFGMSVQGAAKRLSADAEQQLLRITEQAIVNAVRHGSASDVHVTIAFSDRQVRIDVRDNGCGFNLTDVSGESNLHFGIASMQERTREVGGQFSLHSEPGQGTTVTVLVHV
jgi:signal transduction histidine kinase/ligand-binding sensor domain-containing protein